MVSMVVSGKLTIRLIADAFVSFAFVPVAELAGFAWVWRASGRARPFRQAAAIFLVGNLPWLLWCLWVMVAASFISPDGLDRWSGPYRNMFQFGSIGAAAAWSAWLDFHCFPEILSTSTGSTTGYVLVQRTVSWLVGSIYFFAFAIPPFLMRAL